MQRLGDMLPENLSLPGTTALPGEGQKPQDAAQEGGARAQQGAENAAQAANQADQPAGQAVARAAGQTGDQTGDQTASEASEGLGAAQTTNSGAGDAQEAVPSAAQEIPLFDAEWVADFEDTSWIAEIGRSVQVTPIKFAGGVFFDLAMGFLLFGVLWFFIERWLQDTRDAIRKRELWEAEQKEAELERTTLLHRYFITFAILLGACLSIGLFSLRFRVPLVQPLALTVKDWLGNGGMTRIMGVAIVGIVIYTILRLVRKTVRAMTPLSGQRFERQIARAATIRSVIESAARLILITFFVLFVLAQIGVNVSTLLAGVGLLGLAVSFGAQSLVKDVINGFFILVEDQFGVGDVVTIADYSGSVESLSLRITTLRALDGSVHVIPNGIIDRVTVASKQWSRSVVDVELTYDVDLDKALTVINEEAFAFSKALGWNWRIIGAPEISGVENFTPSGILVRTLFKTLPKEQWNVGREFRRRLKLRLDAEGIDLAVPSSRLYMSESKTRAALQAAAPETQSEDGT